MGFLEDLTKWFFSLFVSEESFKVFAENAEEFMNYMVMGVVPIKFIVLGVVVFFTISLFYQFKYNTKSMLQGVIDLNDRIYGAFLFSYGESNDGMKYELKVKEVNVDKLSSGNADFGHTPEITIDTTALTRLNTASEPYRVSRMKYNTTTLFGQFNYLLGIDSTELNSLIHEWRKEFRSLSLSDVQQLSQEDKEKLSFKFMLLNVALNVITIGKDITLLRSNPFYKKGMQFNNDVDNILIELNDSDNKKMELQKVQKELTTLDSVLARNIVLQEYFQAYSASSIVGSEELNTSGSTAYIGVPLQLGNNEKYMAIIIVSQSFHRLPNKNEVFYNIKKTLGKHQRGLRLKNRINRIVFRKK